MEGRKDGKKEDRKEGVDERTEKINILYTFMPNVGTMVKKQIRNSSRVSSSGSHFSFLEEK